jgi:hypothetical protein
MLLFIACDFHHMILPYSALKSNFICYRFAQVIFACFTEHAWISWLHFLRKCFVLTACDFHHMILLYSACKFGFRWMTIYLCMCSICLTVPASMNIQDKLALIHQENASYWQHVTFIIWFCLILHVNFVFVGWLYLCTCNICLTVPASMNIQDKHGFIHQENALYFTACDFHHMILPDLWYPKQKQKI